MQAEYEHTRRQAKARIVNYLLDLAEGNSSATDMGRINLVTLDVEFVRDELMAWATAE
jgi:hypothetical protein